MEALTPSSGPLFRPSLLPQFCVPSLPLLQLKCFTQGYTAGLSEKDLKAFLGFLLSLFSRTENARWSLLPGQTFQPQPIR